MIWKAGDKIGLINGGVRRVNDGKNGDLEGGTA